ncbi:MAG: hypothetical protein ACRCV9_03625 [Burkholderiaceae bacterium]
MLMLACDPGLTGAICLLSQREGAVLECADLPTCSNGQASGSMKRWIDAGALKFMLSEWSIRHRFAENGVHGCVEVPIPMPSLPAQTIGSQFETFGVVRTLLHIKCQGYVHYIRPNDWKKHYALKRDKDESIETALRLYAGAKQYLARKKDHNRAEAILLGHYALGMLS